MESYFGEVSVRVGAQDITLRPSFAALYEIEQQTRRNIPALIGLLQNGSITHAQLCIIMGECGAPIKLTDKQLKVVAPELGSILKQSIGYGDCPISVQMQPLNWHDMFMTYVGVIGRSIEEFWGLTLVEYALALEGYCHAHELELASAAAPATSQDLAEMIQRFPDNIGAKQ